MADSASYLDILNLIIARIRDTVEQFEDTGNCFLSLNPDAVPPSAGSLICIVSPASGSFGQDYFDGGGQAQMQVSGGFIVKIHSPLALDFAGDETDFLTDASSGVIQSMEAVLRSLSGWSPRNQAGTDLSRDQIAPAAFHFSRSSNRIGAAELEFNLNFDWDVSE